MRSVPLILPLLAVLSIAWLATGATVHTELDFFVNEIPDSIGGGFEPHIIAAPGPGGTGEVYYIDSPNGLRSQKSGNLWRSDDHGVSWTFKAKQLGNLGGSGDSYTEVASDGTLYYTDLYGATVTVDTSTDGGDTWIQNPVASTRVIDDRQWLAIGPTVNGLPGMQDETLYLSYNTVEGLVIDRSRITKQALVWEPSVTVTTNTRARDFMAVDRNDGTVYLPNYDGDALYMYVSTDGAMSFDQYKVTDTTNDIQNIFVAIDIDTLGNVYLAWTDQREITMARSTDKGQNWDLFTVTDTNGTRVLPGITAGGPGMVGLTWYETSDVGDCNDLNSTWSLYAAISVDALSDDPTFLITPVLVDMHRGSIATQGFGATSDRDLGDFFTADVDSLGRLIIVSGRDDDDGVNTRQSRVVFMRQREGPFLLPDAGPVAAFISVHDGLTVTFNGSASTVLDGGDIVSWEWSFGDGTNDTGEFVRHRFPGEGTYEVALNVTDSADRIATVTVLVTVRETGENPPNLAPLLALIVLIALGALYLYRRTRRSGGGKGGGATADDGTGKETEVSVDGGEPTTAEIPSVGTPARPPPEEGAPDDRPPEAP
ncbi:MAG TPA: PKD domain-containing protein, partial [Thermoplasmata archaeon]|nr:PKD domain-containing protein [Thermoplasmata archaeon]